MGGVYVCDWWQVRELWTCSVCVCLYVYNVGWVDIDREEISFGMDKLGRGGGGVRVGGGGAGEIYRVWRTGVRTQSGWRLML